MIKRLLLSTVIYLMGTLMPVGAQTGKQGNNTGAKDGVKFLEDISITVAPSTTQVSNPKDVFIDVEFSSKKVFLSSVEAPIENASNLQFKYAILLDQEVEQLNNLGMYKVIDPWMGTRYRLGGSSKDGIDCSALMQVLFSSLYGINLPRTAREQYGFSHKISRTSLKEGDLVFFNTIGGVSHVGMYLQNNKFIHASSGGVMISDLYDDYWLKRIVGVGRVDSPQTAMLLSLKP